LTLSRLIIADDHRLVAESFAKAVSASAEVVGVVSSGAEVLALLATGYTNRQIADQLGITANTVKKHVDHILQKLQVSTRAAAVAVAMRAERN